MRLRHPETTRKDSSIDFGLRPLEPGDPLELFVVVSRDFADAAGPFAFPEAVAVARHATEQGPGIYRVVHLQPAPNVSVVAVEPEKPVERVAPRGQYL